MKHYRCCRCFADMMGPNGPIECPNCGFLYLKDLTKEKQDEAIKAGDDLNVEPRTDEACG